MKKRRSGNEKWRLLHASPHFLLSNARITQPPSRSLSLIFTMQAKEKRPLDLRGRSYYASTLTSAVITNAIDTVITIPITIANIPYFLPLASSLSLFYTEKRSAPTGGFEQFVNFKT